MAIETSVFKLAAIRVSLGLLFSVPIPALLLAIVLEDMGSPAEVLPVMSIDTFISQMVSTLLIERTPECLEMEHVKVLILFHSMKHVNAEFLFRIRECTKVSELAGIDFVWPFLAELSLVLLRMIEVFHSVMSFRAFILKWTGIGLCILAKL